MNIEIHAVNFELLGSGRSGIDSRIRRSLDRFGERLESVRVRFEDLNGPKGGLDHRCHIEAFLVGGTTLRAESRGADQADALDLALPRVRRRIRRTLQRSIARRRSEPSRRRPQPAARRMLA